MPTKINNPMPENPDVTEAAGPKAEDVTLPVPNLQDGAAAPQPAEPVTTPQLSHQRNLDALRGARAAIDAGKSDSDAANLQAGLPLEGRPTQGPPPRFVTPARYASDAARAAATQAGPPEGATVAAPEPDPGDDIPPPAPAPGWARDTDGNLTAHEQIGRLMVMSEHGTERYRVQAVTAHGTLTLSGHGSRAAAEAHRDALAAEMSALRYVPVYDEDADEGPVADDEGPASETGTLTEATDEEAT